MLGMLLGDQLPLKTSQRDILSNPEILSEHRGDNEVDILAVSSVGLGQESIKQLVVYLKGSEIVNRGWILQGGCVEEHEPKRPDIRLVDIELRESLLELKKFEGFRS